MSLNTREQQALLAIEDGLCAGDPKLASMLASFTRLTLDQEMPVHEKMPADVMSPGARRPCGNQQCPPRRRQFRCAGNPHKGLGWQMTGLLLSLLAIAGLIAMSLARLGRSQPPCTDTWAVFCTGGVPATSPPPMRRMGPGHSGSSAQAFRVRPGSGGRTPRNAPDRGYTTSAALSTARSLCTTRRSRPSPCSAPGPDTVDQHPDAVLRSRPVVGPTDPHLMLARHGLLSLHRLLQSQSQRIPQLRSYAPVMVSRRRRPRAWRSRADRRFQRGERALGPGPPGSLQVSA